MQEMKPNIEWKIDGDGLHAGDEAQHRVEIGEDGLHAGDEAQCRVENW
ncbi:hypothetical protein [Metabacillus litoralis]|nr:hypothetical protein [Metabacillus litoralis]